MLSLKLQTAIFIAYNNIWYNPSEVTKDSSDLVEYFWIRKFNPNLGLKEAASQGHLPLVLFFIRKGARNYQKAIISATIHGHTEIVQTLLLQSRYISLNVILLKASTHGHPDIVRMILDNSTHSYLDLHTAIKSASRHGHLEIVKEILSFSNFSELNYNDILASASRGGHLELIRFLLSNIHKQLDYNTALIEPATGGHTEAFKEIINNSNNITLSTYQKALEIAATFGHQEIVDIILHNTSLDYSHALYCAAKGGHTKIVKKLTPLIINPLHYRWAFRYAIDGGNKKVIKLILKEVLKEGLPNYNDALIAAAQRGHLPIVYWMLQLGATDIRWARYWANENKHQKTHDFLTHIIKLIRPP